MSRGTFSDAIVPTPVSTQRHLGSLAVARRQPGAGEYFPSRCKQGTRGAWGKLRRDGPDRYECQTFSTGSIKHSLQMLRLWQARVHRGVAGIAERTSLTISSRAPNHDPDLWGVFAEEHVKHAFLGVRRSCQRPCRSNERCAPEPRIWACAGRGKALRRSQDRMRERRSVSECGTDPLIMSAQPCDRIAWMGCHNAADDWRLVVQLFETSLS